MRGQSAARTRNFWIGVVFCAAGIGLLAYAAWPAWMKTEVFPVTSETLPGAYQLQIEYPELAPAMEPVLVKVTLIPPAGTAALQAVDRFRFVVLSVESNELPIEPGGQTILALPTAHPAGMTWMTALSDPSARSFTLMVGMRAVDEANQPTGDIPIWSKSFTIHGRAGLGEMKIPSILLASFGLLLGLLLIFLHWPSPRPRKRA